jgi:predicted transcriptional regulator
MDVSRPYSSVVPSLDGDVLRVLASSELGLTGREVATRSNRRSHSGVLKVLDRLSEQGLVKRVELNRTHLYSMNREHLAAPAVEILMGMRNSLIDRMRTLSSEWRVSATHLSLFGSAARGDGDVESDIDLFAVRVDSLADTDPLWRGQVEDLRTSAERWTGNSTSVIEVSDTRLAQLAAEGAPVLGELLRDGVLLAGRSLRTLTGAV